jgi:hypothetical protein
MKAADTTFLDSALRIIKVAAKRLDSLETYVPDIDQVHLSALSAEYYMLRVHLVRLVDIVKCAFLLIGLLRLANRVDLTLPITFLPKSR